MKSMENIKLSRYYNVKLKCCIRAKERAALFVAQIAKSLGGADSAIVAEEGYGNPDADL